MAPRFRSLPSLGLTVLLTAAGTLSAQEITVSLGHHSIDVSGVERGAEVVLFGVGRDPRSPGAERFHLTVWDEDRDGAVSWRSATPLPPILVLGATEFRTGRGQMAARGWRPGTRWDDSGSQALELFWLRPGDREWAVRVTHHQLELAGSLRPLLQAVAPDTREGDVVIAIDLSTLRSARMRVPARGVSPAVSHAAGAASDR